VGRPLAGRAVTLRLLTAYREMVAGEAHDH